MNDTHAAGTRIRAADGAEPRVTRPVLPRDKPFRGALHAFRPTPSAHDPTGRAVSNRTDAFGDGTRGMADAAVETAYRVYEEYLNAGERAAAQREAARARRMAMDPFRYDAAMSPGSWLELWKDMYRQWASAVVPLMNGTSAPAYGTHGAPAGYGMPPAYGMPGYGSPSAAPAYGPPSGYGPCAPSPVHTAATSPSSNASAGSAAALDVSIDTTRRCQVQVHMVRQRDGELLHASLHHEESAARIRLSFDSSQVQLSIDDSQPAGRYSGVIRDGASEQVGMVTVTVYPVSSDGR